MTLAEFRLSVRPGAGLVARFPAAALIVTDARWAELPAVDRLLDECRRTPPLGTAVNGGGSEGAGAPVPEAATGRLLPQRLADLVDSFDAADVPAFCALADDAGGLALFVHGATQVAIVGAEPMMRLSGGGAAGWTGNVHDRVSSLYVGPPSGSPATALDDDRIDLREGVVTGEAMVLTPRDRVFRARALPAAAGPAAAVGAPPAAVVGAPPAAVVGAPPAAVGAPPAAVVGAPPAAAVGAPPAAVGPALAPAAPPNAPPTAPPTAADSALSAVPAGAPDPVVLPLPATASSPSTSSTPPPAPPAAAAPVTSSAPPASPAAVDGAPVMVWGIHCKRGHFNNPDARYCRMCGIHMVHQRRDPVLDRRPVLGFLVTDDGSTYKLDADYVIGRDPTGDQRVQGGTARALTLRDPEETVSPVHAVVRLDDWNVVITDAHSRFGTHVWAPGSPTWMRLDPGQTVTLEPRSHILFGRKTLVFDSVNRR